MRTLIALPIMSMLACGAPMPGDQGAIGKPGGAGAMGAPGAMGLPGKDASVAGSRLRPAVYVGSDEHCQIQPMGTPLTMRGLVSGEQLGAIPSRAYPDRSGSAGERRREQPLRCTTWIPYALHPMCHKSRGNARRTKKWPCLGAQAGPRATRGCKPRPQRRWHAAIGMSRRGATPENRSRKYLQW